MSRLIDTIPPPKVVKEKKVIVVSRSRCGTFSLYQALNLLGYKSYHVYEIFMSGAKTMKLWQEALECKYHGKGKPYTKDDFEKMIGNYDGFQYNNMCSPPVFANQAIVEIPQFFLEEFIAWYPNAKFILTERDMDAWRQSMRNSFDPMAAGMHQFPFRLVGMCDEHFDTMREMLIVMESVFYDGRKVYDEEGVRASVEETARINQTAKRLIHASQLLNVRLEDGFGWEQMCPFLGKDIPVERYPRGNAPEEFNSMFWSHNAGAFLKALGAVVMGVVVPVGAMGWLLWKRR